eukprot:scpid25433/ scgid3317/ Neuron navigator 2; Helicase APC down-regulated 1; Pore membrane and/or filament-interacting-like protein 2; Retinoic acid inducible in neuroblastoma 1; Steerin-2; Unc-53 homolog 2
MSALSKNTILSASRRSSGILEDADASNPGSGELQGLDKKLNAIPSSLPSSSSPLLGARGFSDARGLRKTSAYVPATNSFGLTAAADIRSSGETRVSNAMDSASIGIGTGIGGRRQSAPASAFPAKARGRIGVECEEALAWINRTLKKANSEKRAVIDVRRAFADGITLPTVLQGLSGSPIPGVHARPILRLQRAENLKACLQFITDKGIDTTGIKPDDLVNGQLKSVLSLCATIRHQEELLLLPAEGLTEPAAPVVTNSDREAPSKMEVVSDHGLPSRQASTDQVALPGVPIEEREEQDDVSTRNRSSRRSGEVLRPVRQSADMSPTDSSHSADVSMRGQGNNQSGQHHSHSANPQPDVVPTKKTGESVNGHFALSGQNRSPNKAMSSLGRRGVTEAWGDRQEEKDSGSHATDTIQGVSMASSTSSSGIGSTSTVTSRDWNGQAVMPMREIPVSTSHSKCDSSSDSAFASDGTVTSPTTEESSSLSNPGSLDFAKPHSHGPEIGRRTRMLSDGVVTSSRRSPQPMADGFRSVSGLVVRDTSARSPLPNSASNRASHGGSQSSTFSMSPSKNSQPIAKTQSGKVDGGRGGSSSSVFSDSPKKQAANQHRQVADQQDRSPLFNSPKTSAFDSSPGKHSTTSSAGMTSPVAMSPSAFIATPPSLSSSSPAGDVLLKPQPRLASSPDTAHGSLTEVHQRLSVLETMQTQWEKEKHVMQQQLHDQRRIISALYQQGQALKKKFSKERIHMHNTLEGQDCEMVELARCNAQMNTRLTRLESDTAALQTAQGVQTSAEKHGNRNDAEEMRQSELSMSSLESNERLTLSVPKTPGHSEISIVPTSSTPIDNGAVPAQSQTSHSIGENNGGLSADGSYDKSYSFATPPTSGVKRSAVKVKKFFGQEPPHLLRQWLNTLGYDEHILRKFEKHKVGMLELPFLTETQLKQMKVPVGPRMRILHEIQHLKQQTSQ